MRSRAPLALLLAALALAAGPLAACGDEPASPPSADAGPDGAAEDAHADVAPDGGAGADAPGTPDAGPADVVPDGGADAGSADIAADAGTPDGAPDTATATDTSQEDSSPEDTVTDVATDVATDAVADAATDIAVDAVADAATGPCELWSDACGEGAWCWVFEGTDQLGCGAAGPIAVGEVCTEADGPDPCAAGAVCVAVSNTEARCLALCDDAHPCAGAGQLCSPQYQGLGDGTLGFCMGTDCTPPADGCPEGQKCIPGFGGQTMTCVPAGTAPVGGSCSDSEPCVPGAICGPGTCLALCDAGGDCPATDEHCVWPVPQGPWGYCGYGACDPVLQDGCAAGEGCYVAGSEAGSTLCWDAGTVPVGGDCTDLSSMCVLGADCVEDVTPSGDTTYTCRAFCDAEHPCDPGLTCQSAPKIPSLHFCLP